MGAGAPKFRIWLMMSAGRNEKVAPGNSCGSRARSVLTNPAVGLCPALRLTRISPSCGPIVPVLL